MSDMTIQGYTVADLDLIIAEYDVLLAKLRVNPLMKYAKDDRSGDYLDTAGVIKQRAYYVALRDECTNAASGRGRIRRVIPLG